MTDADGNTKHGQVLVIEDAADQRRVLTDLLEHEGFATLACGSARETVEILQAETVAVAILDLRLPDARGSELLKKIRANDARIRIIVYTGHASFASARDAVNLGAFGYVEKSGAPEQLLRQVHRASQDWMKEALHHSDERYRMLAEMAPVGIFRTGADGRCQYVNERWQEMTGLTPADAEGEGWLRHVHPGDRRRVSEQWRDAVARGCAMSCEYRLSRREDPPIWVVGRALTQTDRDGVVAGYIGTITDITELRVARERAEAASRAKSQFLANMSHEIRTPINSIIGMSHFLGEAELPPDQRENLGILKSSADLLLHLIDAVLDFSKIEAGTLALEDEDFRLVDTAEQVRRLLGPKAAEAGLDFRVEVAESLPEWLRGDASRLLQVLLNLVDNAIKFTPRGSVSFTVASAEDGVVFRVRDTGIGMSAEQTARVFEPFFQADSSMSRRYGGSGLGLTISRRLVELLGGEIEVESTAGSGTTVSFVLRLAPASASAAEPTRERPRPRRPAGEYRILVAEDNPVNRLVACKMVENLGYRVAAAENGREALEALERERFDLVFMDCQMPEIDGYEATRRLRRSPEEPLRTLPIVAVTAHAVLGERERCLAAGMDDYLTKPYREQELAAVLERWLSAAGRVCQTFPTETAP